MKKDSVLVGIIGLLLGLIIGFMFANGINQRGGGAMPTQNAQQNPALPPEHPPIASNAATPAGPDMQAVQEAINLAKSGQNNFEAQMKAADYTYQAQRFDEAIQFLSRANQLQPDNYEAIVLLGNVNYDAGRYAEAEPLYQQALSIRQGSLPKGHPDIALSLNNLALLYHY